MNKSTIVMMFVVILAVLPSTQAFCWWCLAEKVAGVAGGLLGRELEDSVEASTFLELEQAVFNEWDTDMDGYISKSEQGVYSAQIQKVDLDGDGKISKHEFDVDINNL